MKIDMPLNKETKQKIELYKYESYSKSLKPYLERRTIAEHFCSDNTLQLLMKLSSFIRRDSVLSQQKCCALLPGWGLEFFEWPWYIYIYIYIYIRGVFIFGQLHIHIFYYKVSML